MSWAIIADSSCNLRDYIPTAPDCAYAFAPLKIQVAGEEYVDDASLDVAELNERVKTEPSATSSACPSAGEWEELFQKADNIIAVTLSSNLQAAMMPPKWDETSSWMSTHANTAVRLRARTSSSLIREPRAVSSRLS